MKNTDWYRNSSWNEAIRVEFYRRLERSRTPHNKAQYLRLQALHLLEANLHSPALELLELYLRDYPEDLMLTEAHLLYAIALAGVNRNEEALVHFRITIQRQRVYPNLITTVPIDFAIFVLQTKNKELYEEALQELNNYEVRRREIFFPSEKYNLNGLRAILLSLLDRKTEAKFYAEIALAAADLRDSGFRKHKTLGLVANKKSRLHKLLKKLAAA